MSAGNQPAGQGQEFKLRQREAGDERAKRREKNRGGPRPTTDRMSWRARPRGEEVFGGRDQAQALGEPKNAGGWDVDSRTGESWSGKRVVDHLRPCAS